MRVIPHHQYNALERRAIEGGASGSPLTWNLHGRCSDPMEVTFQPSRSIQEGLLVLVVPCRQCQHCLRKRAREWSARAAREWVDAPRTWFATYTFAPLYRSRMLASAEGLHGPELRLALVRESGQLVSLYLKRVRKQSALRYMAVPELHRDGMVHWHALLHTEASWRSLALPWTWGFRKINLVNHGAREIRYVTKYLAKAKLGRVRSSLGYGSKRPIGDSSCDALQSLQEREYQPLTPDKSQSDQYIADFISKLSEYGIYLAP